MRSMKFFLAAALGVFLISASGVWRCAQAEEALILTRAHGNAFTPENPLQLAYDGIRHRTWGTSFIGPAGSAAWFHVPLPLVQPDAGESLFVRQVYLLFQSNTSVITDIQVWDGGYPIHSFTGLALIGKHNEKVEESNQFAVNSKFPVGSGLGVSVRVAFGNDGALGGKPMGEIIFNGAGATLARRVTAAPMPPPVATGRDAARPALGVSPKIEHLPQGKVK